MDRVIGSEFQWLFSKFMIFWNCILHSKLKSEIKKNDFLPKEKVSYACLHISLSSPTRSNLKKKTSTLVRKKTSFPNGDIISSWIFDSWTFNIHNIWKNKNHSQLRFLTDSKASS